MYFAFTGVEPFTAEDANGIIMKQVHEMPTPPTQVNPQLPPWVEMIILKSLVKDPAGRYQRAADVARALVDSYRAASSPRSP
jgi:serine/threonine-protein kinase